MVPVQERQPNHVVSKKADESGREIKKIDVFSLNYIRIIRFFLLSVAAWPRDVLAGRPHRIRFYNYYFLVETSILLPAEVYFIFDQFSKASFFVMGDVYISLVLTILIAYRSILSILKSYGVMFCNFLLKFHLVHFRHKGEYSVMICDKVNRLSYYYTICLFTLMSTSVVSFNIPVIYENWKNGAFGKEPLENITLQFSIHYMLPGFRQENNLVLCTIFNIILSYFCCMMICSLDVFACLIVFQIIGHIKTLQNTLQNFPTPSKQNAPMSFRRKDGTNILVEVVNSFNDQENAIIAQRIKECIEHHLTIVSFADDISQLFGPMLAFNYMYHLFSLSLLLVELLQGVPGAYTRYGPLTLLTLAQLTQLSVTFEVIGTASEKLVIDVYEVPWESMSVSNQKTMCYFLQRVQTPITVSAMGMVDVGVQTMGSILKTTFSYYAFLRTLNP